MNAEIISIGTEILLGEITDTNATWIARQLRDIGVNLFYITAIGDNLGRITGGIRGGLNRSDLVITTGGLGPTVDDMTRQGVADATARELVFEQALLDQIASRFEKFGVQMTENNRQQAYIPQDAIIIENPVGTAPSFIVESEQGIVISLPGVPREMKYLMENSVLPYLRQKMGLPAIIKARILHTAGIGESLLDDQIAALMTLENPTVGLAAHSGQTDIRITARADTPEEAQAMIAPIEAQIRAKVGRFVYGVDGVKLDEALADLLHAQGLQMVLVEAGTRGMVGERLGKIKHAAEVVKSIRHLPDVAALGIAGESLKETALQVAQQARQEHDAAVSLVVLHDGGHAAVAVITPGKEHHRELQLGTDDEAVRWSLQWGMGYIWRYIHEGSA